MKENTKITKKIVLEAIGEIIADLVADQGDIPYVVEGVEVSMEDIRNYVNKTIEQLDTKYDNAKKNAAKKAAEKDGIYTAVEAALTEELQTIDQIAAQVPDQIVEGDKEIEVTRPKIVARLNKIIKAGFATKEQVKAEDGRKVMAYKFVPTNAAEPEE